MLNKSTFLSKNAERITVADKLNTINFEVNESASKKLEELHRIGCSVRSKRRGQHRIPIEARYSWLDSPKLEITEVTFDKVYFDSFGHYGNKVDSHLIAVEELFQSDRDFAKKIRQSIVIERDLILNRNKIAVLKEEWRLKAEIVRLEEELKKVQKTLSK